MLAPLFGFIFDDCDVSYSAPHYEVREGANAAKIELEVPRYRVEDIQVSSDVETGVVTVKGKLPDAASGARNVGDFGHLVVATSPLADFQRTFRFAPSVYDVGALSTSIELGLLTVVVPKRAAGEAAAAAVPAPVPVVAIFNSRDHADHTAPAPSEMSKVWSDRFHIMSMHAVLQDGVPTYHVMFSPAVTKPHLVVELQGRQLIVTVRYHTKDGQEENIVTYSNQAIVPAGTRPEDIYPQFAAGHMTIRLRPHGSGQAVPATVSTGSKPTPPPPAQHSEPAKTADAPTAKVEAAQQK